MLTMELGVVRYGVVVPLLQLAVSLVRFTERLYMGIVLAMLRISRRRRQRRNRNPSRNKAELEDCDDDDLELGGAGPPMVLIHIPISTRYSTFYTHSVAKRT